MDAQVGISSRPAVGQQVLASEDGLYWRSKLTKRGESVSPMF